jgi:hypothetical protein
MTVEDLINNPEFKPEDYEGFVYMITFLDTGRKYIGKKNFLNKTNKKLGKKELAAIPVTRGRRPSKKKVIKESNWKEYFSSSSKVIEEVTKHKPERVERSILKLCKTSKELTYYETKYLFDYNVLSNQEIWMNENILGRFFPKDIE